jgi:hypothetical protein
MLERQRALYRQRSSEAHAVLRVGQAVPDPHLDRIELAAWMMVASALLNLHETLTRP